MADTDAQQKEGETIVEANHVKVIRPGATVRGQALEVEVGDRGVEPAMRKLKRLVATEGVLKSLKQRRAYEKPSEKKRRKQRDAERRRRRAARRLQRRR